MLISRAVDQEGNQFKSQLVLTGVYRYSPTSLLNNFSFSNLYSTSRLNKNEQLQDWLEILHTAYSIPEPKELNLRYSAFKRKVAEIIPVIATKSRLDGLCRALVFKTVLTLFEYSSYTETSRFKDHDHGHQRFSEPNQRTTLSASILHLIPTW